MRGEETSVSLSVFSLLTHPLVCFGRVVFGERFAFPFSLKTCFTDGAFFCLLTLTISLLLIHKHTSLVVHCLLGSQRLCLVTDLECLPRSYGGKIPDARPRNLISPT